MFIKNKGGGVVELVTDFFFWTRKRTGGQGGLNKTRISTRTPARGPAKVESEVESM